MRRIAATAGGMLALLAVAAAPAAGQSSRTIVTEDAFVTRIGTFKPSQNPRLSAAIRAFGSPSSRRGRGSACTVRWRGIGLKIVFANFGSPGVSTCRASVGRAQSFVATGPGFATQPPGSRRVSRRPRSRRCTRTRRSRTAPGPW